MSINIKEESNLNSRITVLEYGQENMSKCLGDLDTKIDKILTNHLPHIQKAIEEQGDKIVAKIEAKFVSKERFSPIEKIVYGMVGLILTAFVAGLITLVIK
jgi:hypothetical protein